MVKSIHQGKTWPITGCSRTWGWAQVSSGRISDRWGRLECWGRLACAGEGRWIGRTVSRETTPDHPDSGAVDVYHPIIGTNSRCAVPAAPDAGPTP